MCYTGLGTGNRVGIDAPVVVDRSRVPCKGPSGGNWGGKDMRRDFRATVGVGLLATLLTIFLSGFWVRSEADFLYVAWGFAAGLASACVLDLVKRKKQHKRG